MRLLAEAGLLDGRRATTHWAFLDRFRDRYPAVSVETDCIFVRDGTLWSSAGMSTAMDMALAMLEEDLGPDAALQVAKDLVLERWRRSGSQPQSSVLIDHPARSNRIHDVITHIRANLSTDLTVEKLADVARMSKRQFTRRFKDETGLTPAKAVERIRLETARDFVTSSSWTIDTIARETGYADTERMRRSFARAAIRRRYCGGSASRNTRAPTERDWPIPDLALQHHGTKGGNCVPPGAPIVNRMFFGRYLLG